MWPQEEKRTKLGGSLLTLEVPKSIHYMPFRATGKHSRVEAEDRREGRVRPQVFIGVSMGKARQGRVNSLRLTSLSNSGSVWTIGVVSSCLIPGTRMIKAEENCSLGSTGLREIWLWID